MAVAIPARVETNEEDEGELGQEAVVPQFPVCKPATTFVFFTQRYFSQYLVPNARGIEGNNLRLLLHSNGVVLVCMDPSHIVIAKQRTVTRVHHNVTRNGQTQDRQQCAANVKGKRKRNAMFSQQETVLLVVETPEAEYKLPACVHGCVIEMNPFLAKDPSLITRAPLTEGYIAIIDPKSTPDFSSFRLLTRAVDPGEMDAGD